MHMPKKEFDKLWKKIPIAAADTVVVKGHDILLIKRDKPPFKGSWVLPGGIIEVGESAEQAAVREVREETGITVKLMGLLGVYSGPKRDPRGTTVAVCYIAEYAKGGGATDGEASEIKFFPRKKLPKNIGFDHAEMIQDALKVLEECSCCK